MKNKLSFKPTAPGLAVLSQMSTDRGSLLNSKGEINAQDNHELMQAIASIMQLAGNGNRVVANEAGVQEIATAAATHREMVQAAFDSREELVALGEMIAENIQLTSAREGFMRRYLARQDVQKGSDVRVRVNKKNIVAVVATGPAQVSTSIIRDNWLYPQEFYVQARIYIEQRDLDRANGDLLDEKYTDALEAIMVQEDRIFKALADKTINIANPVTSVGTLTPSKLAALSRVVANWGIPAKSVLMASDKWADVMAQADFVQSFQTTSYAEELIRTGRLGSIFGMEVATDQFRHPQHKVLSAGEIYVFGAPEQLGVYTDRNGLEANALDATTEKVPGRGWQMHQSMTQTIANPRAVAKGV